MRVAETKIYSFDELSKEAQEKAFEHFRKYPDMYAWQKESNDTLEAFEAIFPIEITGWEYGHREYINFEFYDNDIKDLRGIRLLRYIVNNYWQHLFKGKYYSHTEFKNGNVQTKSRRSKCQVENSCVLTGYMMDDSILEPIYKFLKNPTKDITFEDLINESLHQWLFECSRDYEYAYSDEAIKEFIESNEYEFTENGVNWG